MGVQEGGRRECRSMKRSEEELRDVSEDDSVQRKRRAPKEETER